uniref:urease accessory protein UreH domain-containing protein n=1 Tax=Actinomadura kijaniata TaxID=46161 RepID=UPI000A7A30C7
MDAAALLLSGAGAGLLAGGTTCAAVQLGLLTGAVRGAPGGSRPRDAVAPVAAFLTAKLLVHTALGALLGLVGAALQPGPRARGLLLVLAAALLVLFAFDLLGARWARRLLRRDRPAAGAGHCAPRPGGMRR